MGKIIVTLSSAAITAMRSLSFPHQSYSEVLHPLLHATGNGQRTIDKAQGRLKPAMAVKMGPNNERLDFEISHSNVLTTWYRAVQERCSLLIIEIEFS